MRNLICNVLFIVIISFSCSADHRMDFNSQQWKVWVETETTMHLRWDMREDLIKKHKLVDLTADEITELLGVPDSECDNNYRYNLGAARNGIDYGTLLLEFKNKKVIGFKMIKG